MRVVLLRFPAALLFSVAIMLSATSARAATISNSDAQSFVSDTLSASAVAGSGASNSNTYSGSYTLQLFDGALGVLNSVRIEFSQAVDSSFAGVNGLCAGFSPGDCTGGLGRSFTQSGSVLLGTAAGNAAVSTDSNFINCAFLIGPSGCSGPVARTSPYSEVIDFTSATDIVNFVGTGSFGVDTDLFAQFSLTAGGLAIDAQSGMSFLWGGSATVIYDYTSASTGIPAPAGAAFLLIGFAALARRKRG
jgi:hypothetical protein